jgi:hypothetical protein
MSWWKKRKHVIVCDIVPVGVFVYAQQERKRKMNITDSYMQHRKAPVSGGQPKVTNSFVCKKVSFT